MLVITEPNTGNEMIKIIRLLKSEDMVLPFGR